jgi:hypothetical protein
MSHIGQPGIAAGDLPGPGDPINYRPNFGRFRSTSPSGGSVGGFTSSLKERPDIGAAMAADLAEESRLQVREPDVVGPLRGVDHGRMRAVVIAAEGDDAGRAG